MTTKTTWLVGAGISKEAGYPLVSDFLNPQYYQRMLNTSNYPDGITQRLLPKFEKFARLGQDLNSLMAHYLDSGDTESAQELNTLIMLTLDEVRWFNQEGNEVPYIHAFVDQLGASESSVLSFNYDTVIEELVTYLYTDCYYEHGLEEPIPYTLGLDETDLIDTEGICRLFDFGAGFLSSLPPTRGRLKILKLHGSTCLRYCTVCKSVSYVLPPIAPGQYHFYETRPTFKNHCSKCDKETEVSMLFVPPASDERFPTWQLLNRLWQQAKEELLSSDILVVAGYSLPADDKRARSLLEEVSAAKPELRVLVVDPVAHEDFRDRFRKIFPQAVFLQRSFKGLMGILMTLRTRDGASMLKDVEEEAKFLQRSFKGLMEIFTSPRSSDSASMFKDVEEETKALLLAMVAPSASRLGGELPGTLPLTRCLDDCFESNDMVWDHRMKATQLLGLSPAFQPHITAKAALKGADDHLRGICAKALGGFGNQEAVDALAKLVRLTAPIKLNLSPQMENAFIFPQSIATFALVGVRKAAAIDPWLNYGQVAVELKRAWGTMMETDRMQAGTTLELIRKLRENR